MRNIQQRDHLTKEFIFPIRAVQQQSGSKLKRICTIKKATINLQRGG
jgi:hypothetical protein